MSAPRRPRAQTAQSDVISGDRAFLERCGLVNAAGQVVGVEGPHPDAYLLEMIAEFTTLKHLVQARFDRLNKYKEGGKVWRRLWNELLSTRDREEELEQEIVATKAHTVLALLAKMGVFCEMHENGGTFVGRPVAVLREAMAMLEGDPVHVPREPA